MIEIEPCQSQRLIRRVVCAAIRFHDGLVVCSPRHFDAAAINVLARLDTPAISRSSMQGFVDQHGVFMDRQEAWKVAEAAGQVAYRVGGDESNGGTLYSENLY